MFRFFFLVVLLIAGSAALEQRGQDIVGDGSVVDEFEGSGLASSLDGSIIATAASWANRVRVWRFDPSSGGQWIKFGDITFPRGDIYTLFGDGIALSHDGTRLVIGGSGAFSEKGLVRVYEYQADKWVQLGADFIGETREMHLGRDVAISGDGNIIAFGIPHLAQFKGGVDVYSWSAVTSSWTRVGQPLRSVYRAYMGGSVDLSTDGTRLAVGSRLDSYTLGSAQIFEIAGDVWQRVGQKIVGGPSYYDRFGVDVDLNGWGDRIVVGAYTSDSPIYNSGSAYVYEEQSSVWVLIGAFNGTNPSDKLGESVSMSNDGNVVALGAPNRDFGGRANAGEVEVHRFNGASWEQIGRVEGDGVDTTTGDMFGEEVTISGDGSTLLVGSPGSCGALQTGYVRAFDIPPPAATAISSAPTQGAGASDATTSASSQGGTGTTDAPTEAPTQGAGASDATTSASSQGGTGTTDAPTEAKGGTEKRYELSAISSGHSLRISAAIFAAVAVSLIVC